MNILVGYDGSNAAKETLELARKHAMVGEAKIEVVNCMAQNCILRFRNFSKSTIPETLMDSELFSHEKGAFTGDWGPSHVKRLTLHNKWPKTRPF